MNFPRNSRPEAVIASSPETDVTGAGWNAGLAIDPTDFSHQLANLQSSMSQANGAQANGSQANAPQASALRARVEAEVPVLK